MKPTSSRAVAALCLLLAATLAASRLSERRVPEYLAQPLDSIGTELAGWRAAQELSVDDKVLGQLRPTSLLSRLYRKDQDELGLFIAYYAEQRAGESMHSPKHCLPGSGWEIWKRNSVEVPFEDRMVTINRYAIRKGMQRMLVLYWYQSRSRVIANEYTGKVLLVRDALLDGRTAGSIVRINIADNPHSEEAGLIFAKAVMAELQRCLKPRRAPEQT
ncbi:MAG: EpsI family protein [Bryobacteraceae bacterium]|nr:EpsI family protein [Bryobacteraceae bacterium]HEU0139520.1 EpsI family protein [Bryobacteraceae bacterium]